MKHNARPLLLLAVTLLAAVAHPPRAAAEDAPPALRHDIGAYALFGRSSVHWYGATAMPRRGATGSSAAVEFLARTAAGGDEGYVAAPTVVARDGTGIHAVFTNDFDASADVTVSHGPLPFVAPLVADADLPRLPAVTCGGPDVTVDASNSPLALAPGRYGNVTVSADQVLRLADSGRYEICSLRVRAGATVEAHAGDLVLLRDYMTTAARARITGAGACGARWIALATTPSPAPASAGFDFGQGTGVQNRALIQGQFLTSGRITMAQHNDYVGRFWADRIDGLAADPVSRTVADCLEPHCGDGVVDPGEACDDGNNLEGDCCSATCEVMAPGAACDDHLFCTTGDACDAGARCVGGGSPCQAPDGDANCSESCNEDTDACDAPDPDASPCDDGLWCNGPDLCASGACVAHQGSPCPGADGDANCRESCDEASRTCTAFDAAGSPCDDGRFCTAGESCDGAGACRGGFSPCEGADGDADCAESCDELADACTAFDPEGSSCDDALFCTASDRCDGRGRCVGTGDPCAASRGDGDADCSESCEEASASCSAPDPNGAPCSDGLSCTLDERCVGGTCQAGERTSCDDGNPCTDEFCAPDGQCLRSFNEAPCDDGNACTTVDRCSAGACRGQGLVDCRDGDLCTSDVCDPADGSCRHAFAPADSCHDASVSRMRVEVGYSPKDGEVAEMLTASWRGGLDVTAREEIGAPEDGEAFALCFYDESEGLPGLAYRLDFDPAHLDGSAWKRTWRASDATWKLKAPAGTAQGVSQVRLVVDKDGSPSFRVKAGANVGCGADCRAKFSPPAAREDGRLFAMQPAMTVQWVSSTGACWTSRYEEASVNTGASFRARARSR